MEEYLVHHGILGQKWGVRRFQNADGTLTEAGKKHAQSLKDNSSFKYAVGDKRMNRRLDRYEKIIDRTSTATTLNNQLKSGEIQAATKTVRELLEHPGRVEKVGEKTIKQRAVSSIVGTATAGMSFVLAASAESATPLIGIPVSAIAAGAYWYNTTR